MKRANSLSCLHNSMAAPADWPDALTQWYHQRQRKLPWRNQSPTDPYPIWVSEIMLQQTQVDTVIPYFNRFMAAFPTVAELAKADEDAVLKLWAGLGYYSRARNLHAAAKQIAQTGWPTQYTQLKQLPGLGFYTAAAVASLAFGEPVPVVDGNVIRVFTRFFGLPEDSTTQRMKTDLFDRLLPAIQNQKPADFNQAMMELGALVCKPKNPNCPDCPLQSGCFATINNQIEHLPNRPARKKVPHYHVGIGVIQHNNRVLIGKRKKEQMLGGLWEFPGGKQLPNESLTETVVREVYEETGLTVKCTTAIASINHAYSHFKITVHAYWCTLVSGTATPITTDALCWVSLSELHQYPFPTASVKIINHLHPT